MLVVAIAGVGVWGVKMWRLSREYASKAQNSQYLEAFYSRLEAIRLRSIQQNQELLGQSDAIDTSVDVPTKESTKRPQRWAAKSRADAARYATLTAHYAALAHKYGRAARYPWLPVEPDSAEP
jgi:hypothetical protein